MNNHVKNRPKKWQCKWNKFDFSSTNSWFVESGTDCHGHKGTINKEYKMVIKRKWVLVVVPGHYFGLCSRHYTWCRQHGICWAKNLLARDHWVNIHFLPKIIGILFEFQRKKTTRDGKSVISGTESTTNSGRNILTLILCI